MLKQRLRRIESMMERQASRSRAMQSTPAAAKSAGRRFDGDEDWLKAFDEWGQQGVFACEPDFPDALVYYRDAIRRAQAQTDPPFEPPADFLPHEKDRSLRLVNWRTASRFPHVREGWFWLAGMLRRRHNGAPPVTQDEFRELATWFATHEKRLAACSQSSLLDLGEGRRESTINMRLNLERGPRDFHAGKVAEDVRSLRARYGEG